MDNEAHSELAEPGPNHYFSWFAEVIIFS
jgi:hypothetical protein